jgi:copper(I)-binding protein
MHLHVPVRRPQVRRLAAAILLTTTLTATTAGCSHDLITVSTGSSTDAAHLTVSDAWVKAAPSGMTGAFATLANDSGDALRLISVTTDRAATVELHETVGDGVGGMTMRPRKGGFTIKAHAAHRLAPGGDHLMLMGLDRALAPGERVAFVLHLSDGSTKTVTALVKDFTGAQEKYSGTSPSASPTGMAGMTGTEPGSDG